MAETAKIVQNYSQNAYVWPAISKTVFKIFLAQILRKLQIYGVNGGLAGAAKNGGNGKYRSKSKARMFMFGLRFPKLSLKSF